MHRLALVSVPLCLLSSPVLAADLDGPVYRERETVIETPAPRVVERERIIEHRYYEPAPVYAAPRIDYAPNVYVEYDRPYYDRPYVYGYTAWRPRFFPHRHHWRAYHHGRRW